MYYKSALETTDVKYTQIDYALNGTTCSWSRSLTIIGIPFSLARSTPEFL